MSKKIPCALIILDGFGIAPPAEANAISSCQKPYLDTLINTYPTFLLQASGLAVGLPEGEVGNSEVGHMTIGSGVLRYQSLPRIDQAIESGAFFNNKILRSIVEHLERTDGKLHLIGLIGNGGVHAHQRHLEALLLWARKEKIHKQTFIHAFLDGRDTQKDVGASFMQQLLEACKKQKIAGVASVCGRKLAMDRNQGWDRTQKAYRAIFSGESEHSSTDPLAAIQEQYAKGVFDEEMEPIVIQNTKGQSQATVAQGDAIIFFNFRADRARQFAQAAADPQFSAFAREAIENLKIVTFTEYEKNLPVQVLFEPEPIVNPLAKVFSDAGLRQLHIAETEKYAHVTFFINGMTEEPFVGEERALIPSPAVSSYDERPEMSANEVTQRILDSVQSGAHDVYIINYANPDMVGHTGNLEATRKAVEVADACVQKVVGAILEKNGFVLIVGDHGNAEELIHPVTKLVDKEHNNYPVPCILVSEEHKHLRNSEITPGNIHLQTPVGILSDVAPTFLRASGLAIPPEMTGTSLI